MGNIYIGIDVSLDSTGLTIRYADKIEYINHPDEKVWITEEYTEPYYVSETRTYPVYKPIEDCLVIAHEQFLKDMKLKKV